MRRTLLLTTTILITISLLPSPTVQTQQPEQDQFPKPHNPEIDKFPKPETYPPAGPNCKNKVQLAPWLGMPGAGPGKNICRLTVYNCQTDKTDVYESGPRDSETVSLDCSDYESAKDAIGRIEICCDEKEPCETPTANRLPPWFDERSCSQAKTVGLSLSALKVDEFTGALLGPGEIRCVAEYTACSSIPGIVDQTLSSVKSVMINLNAWNSADYLKAANSACQSFFNEHRSAPRRKICCDKKYNSLDNYFGRCSRYHDVDCDGIGNVYDSLPFHPRSNEYTSEVPETPFPFWKDFKNAVPLEPCPCKWKFLDARYKCTNVRVHSSAARGSSNQAKYDYQAKWRCPATGQEIITTRQMTMPGLYCPRGRANN